MIHRIECNAENVSDMDPTIIVHLKVLEQLKLTSPSLFLTPVQLLIARYNMCAASHTLVCAHAHAPVYARSHMYKICEYS